MYSLNIFHQVFFDKWWKFAFFTRKHFSAGTSAGKSALGTATVHYITVFDNRKWKSTSNIFNINIGLIAGHVLVCHMGSDTWRHLKQRDSVMAGRWLGHLGHPAGSPRHCNRGHHEIANTNSNLVHFLLMTKKCLNVRQKLNFHNFPSLIHSLPRHAEQLLFSCLHSKETVYSRKLQCFYGPPQQQHHPILWF